MTTTVLQNITVLSANQQMQPENRGQAINATVVNVLVTPEQAEILTLAGSEGRITLVLRNAIDQKVDPVPMHETAELYNGFRKRRPWRDSQGHAAAEAALRRRSAAPSAAARAGRGARRNHHDSRT